MRINVKLDYEGQCSRLTSRPSARPQPALASCRFKSAVLKLPHLNQVQLQNNYNNKEVKYDDNDNKSAQTLAGLSLAFHEELDGQKHHQNRKNEKKKNGKKNEYQYEGQYEPYGQQQQEHAQRQPSVSKSKQEAGARSNDHDVIRGNESMTTNDDLNDSTAIESGSAESHRNVKRKKDYKRVGISESSAAKRAVTNVAQSGKMRSNSNTSSEKEPPQPMLLPTGRAHDGGIKVNDRKQHPRVRGADLYVVRIGWSGTAQSKPPKATARPSVQAPGANSAAAVEDPLSSSIESLSSLSITSSSSGAGSLHDELINREPSPSPANQPAHDCSFFDKDKIHASRPCYRCVAFMNQVGIRRVFWTNDAGEWEGGKVAALIEAMDTGMENAAKGGPTGNGVFVTKHEVLMLRRMMGAKASM